MLTQAQRIETSDEFLPARQAAGGVSSWVCLLLLLISFLLLYTFTNPTEGGDTLRYAADVVRRIHGHSAQFWEFGHLLWRPWGYFGFKLLGPLFIQHYGDSEVQAVARFLIYTNFLCSLLALLCFWGIVRRFVGLPLATALAVAFCGTNGFLGYVALGSAYVPALCFECLSLWMLTRPARTTGGFLFSAALAGFSYALCVLLWFPFAFVGLGFVAAALLWRSSTAKLPLLRVFKSNVQRALVFLVTAAIVSAAGLAAGAAFYGVHSVPDVRKWIIESDNGWSQHLNIVRAATGIPRSLYELTSGNVLLKRWFFHDPYNPVHLPQLVGALLIKLVLFYVGMVALLLALLKRTGHFMLLTLLSAAVPVLFFAVFVFEPGSTSRYVPLLPFLYVAFAVALQISTKKPWLLGSMAVVLISVVLFNIASFSSHSGQTAQTIREQKRELEAIMKHPAEVFVPTLRDPLYYVPLTHPLDHTVASERYEVTDVVEFASVRLPHWRAEFAARTLQAWKHGREVWISQKLLAPRPAIHEVWVEGDDPRLRWKDLPEYFQQFTTDREEGGADGFQRLAPTPTNQALLQKALTSDPEFKARNL